VYYINATLDQMEDIDIPNTNLVVLTFPFGIGTLEVFDGVFVEDPESGGDFVDEVVVVSD